VVECFSSTPGIAKYKEIYRLYQEKGRYCDVVIVGYPGFTLAPIARLFVRQPIIFDAGWSLYEGTIISRYPEKKRSLFALYIWLTDVLACWSARKVLVETEQQKKFFQKTFHVPESKLERVFTSCDEECFYPDPGQVLPVRFTVLFRGGFLPEAGVRCILEAAKILEREPIDFIIMGQGFLEKEIKRYAQELGLANVRFDTNMYPFQELRERMAFAHINLGQLERHERLIRTIPHKAFEAAAMGMPYLTARTPGIQELFEEGKECLMFEPGNSAELAVKIQELKNNDALRRSLGEKMHQKYTVAASQKVVGERILSLIRATIG